jgi:hypothetical protein
MEASEPSKSIREDVGAAEPSPAETHKTWDPENRHGSVARKVAKRLARQANQGLAETSRHPISCTVAIEGAVRSRR